MALLHCLYFTHLKNIYTLVNICTNCHRFAQNHWPSLKCQNNIYDYNELSFKDEIIELSECLSHDKINDIVDYLDENEKLINIYNLDKKIFIINCFSKLLKKQWKIII